MLKQIRTSFCHFYTRAKQFLTHDIRYAQLNHLPSCKRLGYKIARVVVYTAQNLYQGKINVQASALTFNTVLAIVPMLAMLFAIARGFGFQNVVQSELARFFVGQEEALGKATEFAESTLQYSQSGVFIGLGLALLLYTVISLIYSVEHIFNDIWNVKKERSYFRLFTDYLSLIFIVPIFMIFSSGSSILLSAFMDRLYLLDKLVVPAMQFLPFVLIILLFTFIYIYIPNTKVKFRYALFGGLVAGFLFQTFQLLYISGQLWISRYNAIYGSFAALPLLLLWLQLSWYICLLGMMLTEATQNVHKLTLSKEDRNISIRYRETFAVLIMALITKRFEQDKPAYSADELSENHNIPSQIVENLLYDLVKIGLLADSEDSKRRLRVYRPAMDIHQITLNELFTRMRKCGYENFSAPDFTHTELKALLSDFWQPSERFQTLLVKDVPIRNINT